MRLRIVLIEDEAREPLSASIHDLGDFEVLAFPPPGDLSLCKILEANADLFLIDYELDTPQPDDSIAHYRGATLAARVREEKPEFPIVLLTRSSLGTWTSAQRTIRAGRTFDGVLYKDTHLRRDRDTARAKLVSLARGYEALRNSEDRTVSALLDLLQTDDVGREEALKAVPPDDGWKAVEAAHWVRSILLRYPGVLYGLAFAATALGISIDSFNQAPMMELLKPAEYQGIFNEERQRWWRHRLFEVANDLCLASDRTLGLREGFRAAAGERVGLDLGRSLDVETGDRADTVCHLLDIPTRIESSLPYRPDARPQVMDEARISFKAIRETNLVEENYLDSESKILLKDIRQAPHAS